MKTRAGILFVDGECVLCTGLIVRLVSLLDRKGRIAFSSLQGETAEGYRKEGRFPSGDIDSLVYRRETGECFVKSRGVMEMGRDAGGLLAALRIIKIIPRSWGDGVYDFIAARRHEWFGKKSSCGLPEEQLKQRTLP